MTSQTSTPSRRTRRSSAAAWLLGVVASLACTLSMVLPAIGVAGSAAAGATRGADGTGAVGSGSPIDPLLIGSIALVTLGLGWRRRLAAIPALAFGGLLYAGLYGQPSTAVLYLSLVLGYAGWIGTYLWTRRRPAPRPVSDG